MRWQTKLIAFLGGFGCAAAFAAFVITLDLLTYGHPPGLFKNAVWQFIRQLWT